MTLRRLGFIGAGGMTETVLTTLAERLDDRLELLSVLILPEFADLAKELIDRQGDSIATTTRLHTNLEQYLADVPELVVECAGQMAVRQYGREILRAGIDFLVVSTGAFADDAFRLQAEAAATAGRAKLIVSSGAIGGIDVLGAARLSGLREVTYTGRKPPNAWLGTPAERLPDLTNLTEEVAFFKGTAREAARSYPQNANVSATVALAGSGFDETRVTLIADPMVSRNIHEVSVRSECADFVITLQGWASPSQPKTSLTAGFRIAREILDRRSCIVI